MKLNEDVTTLLEDPQRNSEMQSRNKTIALLALYDAVETAPGEWRPYTLKEIGQRFGLTRERVRQVINMTADPYSLILKRRARKRQLYKQALAALRRARTITVYKCGPRKGRVRAEYTAYRAMLQRVFNPNNPNYPRYGCRGVTVCERWLGPHGYRQFFDDLGPRPNRHNQMSKRVGYSLHRINNAFSIDNEMGYGKQARGFRQFLLRGLQKVQGEWALVCLTHNILKLHRLCYGSS